MNREVWEPHLKIMTPEQNIQECKKDKKRLLTQNLTMSVKEIEDMTASWKVSGAKRASGLAASFSNILELEAHHLTHFKTAPYMFKPMSGSLWGGMLLDDKLDYIHLVMMTEDVLLYILKL